MLSENKGKFNQKKKKRKFNFRFGVFFLSLFFDWNRFFEQNASEVCFWGGGEDEEEEMVSLICGDVFCCGWRSVVRCNKNEIIFVSKRQFMGKICNESVFFR